MTISYSLDVAQARFCGFSKLLTRWRGSIYKILWKEFLLFCVAYTFISIIYRNILNPQQREIFEKVVIYVETFTDLIPLSFVLGFYVSLVVGRWWNQYEAIPWPDRTSFTIASYVHGSDERSRKIRRTLGRYLILMQVLTFQTVSTAVKRRFPTTQHLVAAGIMTKEEQSVFESVSFPYGKYWIPCQWFTALATRAKKEGRIKDSILLDGIFREVLSFRNNCAIMIAYDCVSVPLVYTQVVTIATYLYSIGLLVGRQYLDPSKGYSKFQMDLYIPIFTLLQFFFYVGWLKVAEQILNPYGEDDDDYELNWCLDRAINIVYLIVDHLQMKHPKVKQDEFWDETEIRLPQTKHSAKFIKNPQLGSAFNLEFGEPEYIPMNELLEEDSSEHLYSTESLKRKSASRQNSSFIRRILNSGVAQSFRRKSRKHSTSKTLPNRQGCSNPAFSLADEADERASCRNSLTNNRKLSKKGLAKKVSSNSNSVKFKSTKKKSYNLQEVEEEQSTKDVQPEQTTNDQLVSRTMSAPAVKLNTKFCERGDTSDDDFEDYPEDHGMDVLMPSIPEEASRANSVASIELIAAVQRGEKVSQQMDRVHDLVKEASDVLEEFSKSRALQESHKDNESKGYESCCSTDPGKSSSEDSSEEDTENVLETPEKNDVFVVIENNQTEGKDRL